MSLEMTDSEKRWLRRKWEKIRESQRLADEADIKWKEIGAALNEYLDRKFITDIVQRTKIKAESIALKDALETGKWHSRNAERHIHDVSLFIKLRELDVL